MMAGEMPAVPDVHTNLTDVRDVADLHIRAMLAPVLSLVKPELKQVIPNLGVVRNATNEKARSILGWKPRSNQEVITATAKSLLKQGVVKA